MRSETEIKDALRTWIVSHSKTLEPDQLTDTTALFEERHLRSVHLSEFLLLIERLTAAPIDVENLKAGDFRDLGTIMARFVTARTQDAL